MRLPPRIQFAAAIAGALVAANLLMIVLGCGGVTPKTRKTYPRDEFKRMLTGKTQQEVIDAIGRPDQTLEAGGSQSWIYERATTDPSSGKPDLSVMIRFDGRGKVADFIF